MKRPLCFFDIEIYKNYALLAFRDEQGVKTKWEARGATVTFPPGVIAKFVKQYTLITFNGNNFDMPLLMLAIRGDNVSTMKKAANRIIVDGLKPWNFEKEFHVKINRPEIDTIDIMEVAPLTGSLKLYAGKVHAFSIQDLPLPPDADVSEQDMDTLVDYCFNDLLSTRDLYNALKVQIEMRIAMSATYGIDLRSKSDAQMAEAIITSEVEKLKKIKLKKPGDRSGMAFKYKIPKWVEFMEIDILGDIEKAEFMVSDKGSTLLPPELKDREIHHRGKVYRMGVGGLHSSETKQVIRAEGDLLLMDFDVASYYPSIVLNEQLFPAHIGPEFLQVYRSLVQKRLAYKKQASELKDRIKKLPHPDPVLPEELKKVTAAMEGLKIAVNGTFGKLGSKWSVLYSPDLLIQVTVTGQLALLMLIEAIACIPGVEVVSANTDGVMVACDKILEDAVLYAVKEWETTTGYVTERADFQAIFARDVNNYVAVKVDGATKSKGAYGKGLPLHKNPNAEICGDAVLDYLMYDASLEQTVRLCEDIRKFVKVQKVTGGAKYDEIAIGKVARWYYAKGCTKDIRYVTNNKLVPQTVGAVPLIELPFDVPEDLDYDWYVNEAKTMIWDLGLTVDGEGPPEVVKKGRKKKVQEEVLA